MPFVCCASPYSNTGTSASEGSPVLAPPAMPRLCVAPRECCRARQVLQPACHTCRRINVRESRVFFSTVFPSMSPKVLRKLPSLTIPESLWQSHSQFQRLTLLEPKSPFTVTQEVPAGLPALPPTHSQTRLPIAEPTMSLLHKAAYSCAGTEKQLEMLHPRRNPNKGTPELLSPLSPKLLFFPSPGLLKVCDSPGCATGPFCHAKG